MVLNKKLEKPFNKVPPDGNNLNMVQATEVKAKLSQKVKNIMNKRDKSEERKLKFQDCKTALLDANTVHTRVDEAIQQVGLHN